MEDEQKLTIMTCNVNVKGEKDDIFFENLNSILKGVDIALLQEVHLKRHEIREKFLDKLNGFKSLYCEEEVREEQIPLSSNKKERKKKKGDNVGDNVAIEDKGSSLCVIYKEDFTKTWKDFAYFRDNRRSTGYLDLKARAEFGKRSDSEAEVKTFEQTGKKADKTIKVESQKGHVAAEIMICQLGDILIVNLHIKSDPHATKGNLLGITSYIWNKIWERNFTDFVCGGDFNFVVRTKDWQGKKWDNQAENKIKIHEKFINFFEAEDIYPPRTSAPPIYTHGTKRTDRLYIDKRLLWRIESVTTHEKLSDHKPVSFTARKSETDPICRICEIQLDIEDSECKRCWKCCLHVHKRCCVELSLEPQQSTEFTCTKCSIKNMDGLVRSLTMEWITFRRGIKNTHEQEVRKNVKEMNEIVKSLREKWRQLRQ